MDSKKERRHPEKAFRERFGWFWFRYQEIFEDTEEDIERKIRPYHDRGVTQLILFSNTHARLTFAPFHRQINDCIGKIVKACHKFGIRVTEHHSSCLCRIMTPEEEIAMMKEFRRGVPADWTPWSKQKQETPLNWFQKDRSGRNYVTGYHAFAACFNNKEYRDFYFRYLDDVYRQGVDGIMTDDVQYLCWNLETCFCDDCRRRYREQYGCELPDEARWDAWFGNMADPSFVLWLKNRFDSTLDFHRDVLEHYRKKGLRLYRPNYCSWRLSINQTAYCLDELPALDLAFMECCHRDIIRYAWLWWMMEFLNRRLIAEKRNIPVMMQTYVATENAMHFGFAFAQTSGALYSNACAFLKEPLNEKTLRDFEDQYADYVYELKPLKGIGVLDSLDNRYFGVGYDFGRWEYWLESAIYYSVPVRLADTKTPEMWDNFSALCLLDFHRIGDRELNGLMAYAENGGTLLAAGQTAEQDEDGRFRSAEEIRRVFGLHPVEDLEDLEVRTVPRGRGKIVFVGPVFGFGPDLAQARRTLADNPERLRYGQYPAYCPSVRPVGTPFSNSRDEQKVMWKTEENVFDGMRELAEFLRTLLNEECFRAEGLPEGVVATAWRAVNGETVIKIMNAAGTFSVKKGDMVSHWDPIPFPRLSGTARFKVPGTWSQARFAGLDGKNCPLENRGNTVFFPLENLGEFGMIICG